MSVSSSSDVDEFAQPDVELSQSQQTFDVDVTYVTDDDEQYVLLPSVDDDALPPEDELGNVEYKLHLVHIGEARLDKLTTQLKWRLEEGNGVAIYKVGVADDGQIVGLTDEQYEQSLATLKLMVGRLENVEIYECHRRLVYCAPTISEPDLLASTSTTPKKRKQEDKPDDKFYLEARIKAIQGKMLQSFKICFIGPTDAGKSTLLGTLMYGEKDNGRGKSRMNLFRHPHEMTTGLTSSISSDSIGVNLKTGKLVTYASSLASIENVISESHGLIQIFDLPGHQKFFKTTMSGLLTSHPHLVSLVLSSVQLLHSVTSGTESPSFYQANQTPLVDNFTCALLATLNGMYRVPLFVILTKIDQVRLDDDYVTDRLVSIIRSLLPDKEVFLVENQKDLKQLIRGFPLCRKSIGPSIDEEDKVSSSTPGDVLPVFLVSSVTGDGLALVKKFFSSLSFERVFEQSYHASQQPSPNLSLSPSRMATLPSTDTLFYIYAYWNQCDGAAEDEIVAAGVLVRGALKRGQRLTLILSGVATSTTTPNGRQRRKQVQSGDHDHAVRRPHYVVHRRIVKIKSIHWNRQPVDCLRATQPIADPHHDYAQCCVAFKHLRSTATTPVGPLRDLRPFQAQKSASGVKIHKGTVLIDDRNSVHQSLVAGFFDAVILKKHGDDVGSLSPQSSVQSNSKRDDEEVDEGGLSFEAGDSSSPNPTIPTKSPKMFGRLYHFSVCQPVEVSFIKAPSNAVELVGGGNEASYVRIKFTRRPECVMFDEPFLIVFNESTATSSSASLSNVNGLCLSPEAVPSSANSSYQLSASTASFQKHCNSVRIWFGQRLP